jgi:hypothetical protein
MRPKLMTAAEYVAKRGENLDEAIAGDIFVIMADYANYVILYMERYNLTLEQIEIKPCEE